VTIPDFRAGVGRPRANSKPDEGRTGWPRSAPAAAPGPHPAEIVTGKILLVIGNKSKYNVGAWRGTVVFSAEPKRADAIISGTRRKKIVSPSRVREVIAAAAGRVDFQSSQ
jgi:hypothetical protein